MLAAVAVPSATVSLPFALPPAPVASSVSLYLAAFFPVFWGITTSSLTLPDSQEKVIGRPETVLFADSVQLVAPDTDAETIVLPPEETVPGTAESPAITGFDPFA